MKPRLLLSASIVLLGAHTAFAGEPLFPQPFDVAASVGTEQSDFFLLRNSKGTKLVFSALVKELKATKNKGAQDQRAMFSQRIETLGGIETFFEADKSAPVSKSTTFTVPTGTVFDNFIFNGNEENEQAAQGLPQEFFHVPTKGIYFSTGGSPPVLVKAETATAPTFGFALQNPNFTANDHDHSEAFRVVLGATDKKKGPEPFISQGASRTTAALHPSTAPTAILSDPSSFTTFTDPDSEGTAKHVVFFLANDASGGAHVYKTTVETSGKSVKYGAVQVTADSLTSPADLTGSNDGLMFSALVNDVRQLLLSSDGTDTFSTVPQAGTDPQNFVPNVVTGLNGIGSENLAGTGFTALNATDARQFQIVANVAGASAYFTDTSGLLTDPQDIISTGSYFYYSGLDNGFRFAIKDPNDGEQDAEIFLKDQNGQYLVNPTEFTLISGRAPSGLDGTVYFAAQPANALSDPPTLYKIPANDTTAVATQVLTVASAADKNNPNATPTVPITSPHNLRNVSDDTIFRLYFCAPVTDAENSQWRPTEKVGKTTEQVSVGTKPWVLTDQ